MKKPVKKRKKDDIKKRTPFLLKQIMFLAVLSAGFFFYQEFNVTEEKETESIEINADEAPIQEGILATEVESFEINVPEEKSAAPILKMAGLHSPNMILIDRETDKVLAEKKSLEKIYPASLTKIMTVLLGIEQWDGDLNQKSPMKEEYFEDLFAMDASMAGFQIDEIVTYRDILYGAVLPSGAESCLAIAHLIDGSEEAFVIRMNQKAQELGLSNTHFSNTTGLHDPDNYSTVEDIAHLLESALKNKEFLDIFETKQYTTSPTNLSPKGVEMKSSMFKYVEKYPKLEPVLKGGKTGFTEEAGLCLASTAEIDGVPYLLVTAGAPSEEPFESFHIQDAALIYLQLKT